MCVYDKHPLASREIQYRATKSWSEYTTTQQARTGRNIQPLTKSEKLLFLKQNDSFNCVTCKNNPGFQRSLRNRDCSGYVPK